MTWVQPTVTGQALRPRFRHTATLVERNKMIIFGGSSSGVLYNDLGALDVTLYVSPPPPPAPQAQPKKKSAKRAGSSPIDSLTGKGKYKLTVSSDGGDKHMSSPAEFSELVKDFTGGINKPQVGLEAVPASSSSGPAQAPNPSGVHLMQMFLSASMAYKEEHRLREQAEFALQEIRKALFSEQKEKQKVEESRASAEADLVCEREDTIKLRNTKAALEKELKSERKKRRKVEEEKAKLEEELGRLRGAANREVEKRKEMSSVEIEELNRQLAHIKLKLANKREKVKATTRDLALMAQREKERLVDEDASYYATPDFNKLKMDELLRLEEHYLSSLRVVGVAKQKQLQLQVEELQRAKAMLEEQKICSICADREIRVVLIPCGHRCLCRECSTVLNKCPICRKAVSDRIDTY
jgi:hypothetical protein